MVPGAPLMLSVTHGDGEGELPEDDIPGRFFCSWQAGPLHDVLTGAGFAVEAVEVEGRSLFSHSRRARSLPDTVGPGLRLLICGLNPSEVAADAGFGFAGATNRFWSAAMAAGVISRPRDPRHALVEHGVGMTDLVKRASPRASALTVEEYRWGLARVERLVSWLEPRAICFVGLDGWRKAVDAKAVAGWQTRPLGPTPVYVMPSTSGANAHASLAVLVSHLRAAASTPPKL
jgi:TDG/mug DNA glycosylase family protein